MSDGATVIGCSQFSAWGVPWSKEKDCLVIRGKNRPQAGEFAKRDIYGRVVLRVEKINYTNAIDAEYVDIYVVADADGRTYVVGPDVLSRLVKMTRP